MQERMTPSERPFRDILQNLTAAVAEKGLCPEEAYVAFREMMGLDLHVDTYASSSITSGGHARRRVHESGLAMSDVIRENTRLALEICDQLFSNLQLDSHATVEAVGLGYIPTWSQSDYMTFWLLVMAGLPAPGYGVVQTLSEFQQRFTDNCSAASERGELDMDIYNSSRLSADERAPHYFAHAGIFADSLGSTPRTPIKKLVGIVDPGTSLGAKTEKWFAGRIGAHLFRVAVAQIGLQPSELSAPLSVIRDDELITHLGGSVLDRAQDEMLVVVPRSS